MGFRYCLRVYALRFNLGFESEFFVHNPLSFRNIQLFIFNGLFRKSKQSGFFILTSPRMRYDQFGNGINLGYKIGGLCLSAFTITVMIVKFLNVLFLIIVSFQDVISSWMKSTFFLLGWSHIWNQFFLILSYFVILLH